MVNVHLYNENGESLSISLLLLVKPSIGETITIRDENSMKSFTIVDVNHTVVKGKHNILLFVK